MLIWGIGALGREQELRQFDWGKSWRHFTMGQWFSAGIEYQALVSKVNCVWRGEQRKGRDLARRRWPNLKFAKSSKVLEIFIYFFDSLNLYYIRNICDHVCMMANLPLIQLYWTYLIVPLRKQRRKNTGFQTNWVGTSNVPSSMLWFFHFHFHVHFYIVIIWHMVSYSVYKWISQ